MTEWNNNKGVKREGQRFSFWVILFWFCSVLGKTRWPSPPNFWQRPTEKKRWTKAGTEWLHKWSQIWKVQTWYDGVCVQNTRLHNPESGRMVNTNRETERTKQDSVEMKLFSLSDSVGLNDLIFHEKNHDKSGRWSSNMIMSISCLETK